MTVRSLLGFAITLLFAGVASAAGPLPPVQQDDLQIVQSCLSSKTESLGSTCIGVAADACLKSADSQQRMTHCMTRERVVWDLFLNNDYQAIMSNLRFKGRNELREVEREFLRSTERRCTFIRAAWGYSSYIQVVEIEKCWMQATAVQWLWLRNFVEFAKPEKFQ